VTISTISDSQALRLAGDGMLVGGVWGQTRRGARFQVVNPATEEVLSEIPDADPDDAIRALDAAAGAQAEFAATNARDRGEILRGAFEKMVALADELALLVTLENGKPRAEARAEILYAADFFRWFSEETVRIAGRYMRPPSGPSRFLMTKQPVGPALLITPWNFPAAMITRKVGPAIAAGCATILKPAAETPMTALAIAAILQEAGLPDGALNVIPTTQPGPVGQSLMADSRLRKVSFTGSTAVGRTLLGQAAPHVLRSSMELGGNAPFVVFADADQDAAIEGALVAKMRNNGQSCTAANRFYVESAVAEEFAERLATRMAGLSVGEGNKPGVQTGPLIDERGRAKVARLVSEYVAQGAQVRIGGVKLDRPGYFFDATVLTGVASTSAALGEEIFGPVAPVVPFESEAEAIAGANGTPFGLVAYLYTRDLGRAIRVSEAFETGMVGLNTGLVANPAAPFGGVKESGLGREGGSEGVEEFLETKYIALNW
jgi:succinate-semialdehyde dehydrogenase / glutarate-semialdehyde dehydrogenase